MPVKERYKQALKKIYEVIAPELLDKHVKPEKSIAQMMLSSKGSMLDVQKQMTQLGLNIKMLKSIRSSKSTLEEKLVLDKKILETEEEQAIFNILLLIKQRNERKALERGEIEPEDAKFDDLEKFQASGTVFP